MIIEKFKTYLESKNYSKNSISTYINCVYIFINKYSDLNPYKLNQKNLEDFLLNTKFTSISQQNQYISSLKLFYKNILKSKITKINLDRPRKSKPLPKVIDNEFIVNKLKKIENLKHKTILSLIYSVGLRVSEVVNLKIEDIDSKRMIINIRNSKGNKDRIVPLSENILLQLRNYYKKYKPKEYIFNGQNKPKYSVKSCGNIFKKYISNEHSIHSLRHSCFTYLLENGVDIRIIQKLAGHNNVKTAEIYTHVSKQTLNKLNLPL